MSTQTLNRMVGGFLLCVLLANISTAADNGNSPSGRRPGRTEKRYLRQLGLAEDVNDSVIIQLLDVPAKRSYATILIRYRKVSSATPKLLEIFNDDKLPLPSKLIAAEALCDFQNREWMPTMKALSEDPNGIIARTPLKYKVAGLLARAGDYSQFEVLAKGISDKKKHIRANVIFQLGNFGHKTNSVTNLAAELLSSAATSDLESYLRAKAIRSLEKMAKIKPEIHSKVLAALQANVGSQNKRLRNMCIVKLKHYNKKLKEKESNSRNEKSDANEPAK